MELQATEAPRIRPLSSQGGLNLGDAQLKGSWTLVSFPKMKFARQRLRRLLHHEKIGMSKSPAIVEHVTGAHEASEGSGDDRGAVLTIKLPELYAPASTL